MNYREQFAGECFVCHSGHECGSKGIEHLSDVQIEQLYWVVKYAPLEFMLTPAECDAATQYEYLEKYVPHVEFYKKYQKKLDSLKVWQEDTFNVDEFVFDIHEDKIELFWCYETDNGLYVSSGTMKARYHHEPENGTWSKRETESLMNYYDLDYTKIKSFEDFIEQMNIETVYADN